MSLRKLDMFQGLGGTRVFAASQRGAESKPPSYEDLQYRSSRERNTAMFASGGWGGVPVGLLGLLLGLSSALVDGHEVAEHDAG